MSDEVPPPGLTDAAAAFWREWLAVADLERPHDRVRLVEVVRAMSLIDRLEEQLASDGVMVPGSAGQLRLHPAVDALTKARTLLDRQLEHLVPRSRPESPASAKARRAAQARWGVAG